MEKNTLNNWFFNNSWSLIVIIVGFVISFAVLKYQVSANTQMVNFLHERLNSYPTEQYFDLRFKNLEQGLAEVKVELKEIKNQ